MCCMHHDSRCSACQKYHIFFFSTERSDAPIRFGITAGVNFANMSYDVNGVSVSPDSRTGFNVGLTVDIPLIESIYIKTGLGYTVKGSKLEVGNYEEKLSPAYLELPFWQVTAMISATPLSCSLM